MSNNSSIVKSSGVQFRPIKDVEQILSSAMNLPGGVIVRSDFRKLIGDYRIKEAPKIWQIGIKKIPAPGPIINEVIRDQFVQVAEVDRETLEGTPQQYIPDANIPPDENGHIPGESVKAAAGIVDYSHFSLSMQDQQNRLMGEQYQENLAEKTDELIIAMYQLMGDRLVSGDPETNPLQFKGLTRYIPAANHIFTLDITETTYEPIYLTLKKIIVDAKSSRMIKRRITRILCSPAGKFLIEKELEGNHVYQNQVEIVPGITVDTLSVDGEKIPIISDPWVNDVAGATAGTDPDTIRFYLYNHDHFEWNGVIPIPGEQGNWEPQIFDIRTIVADRPLLKQRLAVLYGTTFYRNRGESLYRLDVTAPSGTYYRGN